MSHNEEKLIVWDHIVELLRRLRTIFFSLIASTLFVMLFPLGFNFESSFQDSLSYPTITTLVINKMREDLLPPDVTLLPISWTSPIEVYVYVSLVVGIALSSPVIAYELYKFINPALYKSEKRQITYFITLFSILFVSGLIVSYLTVTPMMMQIFAMTAEPFGIPKIYELTQFFSLVVSSLLVCGFIMTSPLYLFLLVKIGVINVQRYKKIRKYVYGAILITISLIDPDPTLVTETFVGIPLIFLLEITIRLAEALKKR